jgi:osmotically-inducible protein OsmY
MRAQLTGIRKGEPIEDDDLRQIVADRIDEDPAFWTGTGKRRTHIVVEVSDGEVTLTGVVRSVMDRRRADILARALGALSVDNRLRVEAQKSPSEDSHRRSA